MAIDSNWRVGREGESVRLCASEGGGEREHARTRVRAIECASERD